MVAAAHRRRGIGTALLDAALDVGAAHRRAQARAARLPAQRGGDRPVRAVRFSPRGLPAGALPPRERLRRRDPDGARRVGLEFCSGASRRDRGQLLQACGRGTSSRTSRASPSKRCSASSGSSASSSWLRTRGRIGPFPAALEALERGAAELNRYPDGGAYRLRAGSRRAPRRALRGGRARRRARTASSTACPRSRSIRATRSSAAGRPFRAP